MQGTELLRYLRSLVTEHQYVFHGSPYKLERLEPRQALHDVGQPDLNQFGVYGTGSFRIALLYSVIHEDRANWGWKWEPNSSELTVVAPTPLRGGPGYLYVLNPSEFEQCGDNTINRVCRKPTIPIERIDIHPSILEDLQRECEVVLYLPGTI